MDSFINILRGASTPKEGVSSEDTYDNGVGFLNPLVWQTEYPEEYEGAATFPSIVLTPAAAQTGPVVQTSSDDDASASLKKAISDITGGNMDGLIDRLRQMNPNSPVGESGADFMLRNYRNNDDINKYTVQEELFHEDGDGTKYGEGSDGRTYKYTTANGKLTSFSPLSSDEQKEKISQISNGKVTVDDTLNDEKYLTSLLRSVSRLMKDETGDLTIHQPVTVSGYNIPLKNGLGGITMGRTFSLSDPVGLTGIDFYGVGDPSLIKIIQRDAATGYHPVGETNPLDAVTQHELAHAADPGLYDSLGYWLLKNQNEIKNTKGQTTIGDYLNHFLGYLNPFRSIITNDDLRDMEDYSREIKPYTTKLLSEISDRYRKARDEVPYQRRFDLIEEARSNYPPETAASEYGATSEHEDFAEAYTDVLVNGDDASQYSKDLVQAYRDYADALAKAAGYSRIPKNDVQKSTAAMPLQASVPFASQLERIQELLANRG